ncbi:MAG: Rieske 2Fe-2S domain-containing protein [Rhodospirillaceae bacterium]|nr:Rieske 2Fe-2S domain-containing protein [Rhodospirillaceae bacterium]
MDTLPDGLSTLVRGSQFDPRVYGDEALFKLEMERIFDRAWLLVGHDSLLRAPGSYITTRAGSHPILLWRDPSGTIRAFLNRCPHRGARLCGQDRGTAQSFVCPYHGWVFGGDGALKSVPAPEEYGAGFDFAAWGLKEVAGLALYRGFIFVRHTKEGPSLDAFLGDMKSSIDDLVDRAPDGEIEACPVPLRHRYKGNWKLGFENLNDAHHARVAHAATVRAATRVMSELGDAARHPALGIMKANGMPIRQFSQLDMVIADYGHSYIFGFIDGQKGKPHPKEYVDRLTAARGAEETARILGVDRHLTLLYPSATLQGRFSTMRLIQPIRPDLTEIVGYVFRLKGAPASIYEDALHYFHISISPFSPVATDDFDIYEGAQELNGSSAAGPVVVSRLNEAAGAVMNGRNVHRGTSEAFIRNQYAAWLSYLGRGA